MMEAEPGLILAIVGTGVALAALNMTQMAGLRREIAELRHEVNNLGHRVARLEGVLDMIRMGMQLPHPSDAAPDPAHEK